MLKLCANLTLLFSEYPLLDRFAAAKAAGFSAVEIQFPYDTPAAELAQAAHAAGVEVVLINVPAGDLMQGGDGLACVPSATAAFAEALEQAAHYAQVLGVRCVNVLSGRVPVGVEVEEATATLCDNLARAAKVFAPLGITVTCEAINPFDMPRYLINRPEQLADVLKTVDHPALAMQIDLYHMARQDLDPIAVLEAWWPSIAHIQFADFPQRGEPDSGELDFDAIFAYIAAQPYTGYCAAEYRPTRPRTADTLDWMTRLAK